MVHPYKYDELINAVGEGAVVARKNASPEVRRAMAGFFPIGFGSTKCSRMQKLPEEAFAGICRIDCSSCTDTEIIEKKIFHLLVGVKVALQQIICNAQCVRTIQRRFCREYVIFNRALHSIALGLDVVEYLCNRLDYAGDIYKVRGNYLSRPDFVRSTQDDLYKILFSLRMICPDSISDVDHEGDLDTAIYLLIEAICAIQELSSLRNRVLLSDEQLGARSWSASLRRAMTLVINMVLVSAQKAKVANYSRLRHDAAFAIRAVGLVSECTHLTHVRDVSSLINDVVGEFYSLAYQLKERGSIDAVCVSYANVAITSACISWYALNRYNAYMSGCTPEDNSIHICRSYFEKAVICEIYLYALAALCTIENRSIYPRLVSRIESIICLSALVHDRYVDIEQAVLSPKKYKKRKSVNGKEEELRGIEYSIRCICANVACLTLHHKANLNFRTLRYIEGIAICSLKALDIFSDMPALNRSHWLNNDFEVLGVFPGEVKSNARIVFDTARPNTTPYRRLETAYGNDLHKYMSDPYTVDVDIFCARERSPCWHLKSCVITPVATRHSGVEQKYK